MYDPGENDGDAALRGLGLCIITGLPRNDPEEPPSGTRFPPRGAAPPCPTIPPAPPCDSETTTPPARSRTSSSKAPPRTPRGGGFRGIGCGRARFWCDRVG